MYLTEEQAALKESVRKMVEKHIAPIAAKIDRENHIPTEIMELFGDMGLLQMRLPEKYGGMNMSLTDVCLAKEEVAKVSEACSLYVSNNGMSIIYPLVYFGSEEQRQRFLPGLAAGRSLGAIAITEPHAGSNPGAMTTRAVRDGDSYVINGQKCYITNGGTADFVTLFARTDPDSKGVNGISAFMVEAKKTPGFRVGRIEKTMGLRGLHDAELFFEDMRVPAANMIGPEGAGFKNMMRCLDLNRPTIGAASVGLAQGALDCAVAFAKERKQFGRPIAEFQMIQGMLADMAMQIEAARTLVYETTRVADSGDYKRLNYMAAVCKCFASDMVMKVTTDAVQIFGGAGYMEDHPVERFMRDAKINQIFEGTNQIQRLIIARHLVE
ncbi:MAG: acyl-CoA dehydrogenase family protein [Burkholderiaceae bacterium]|nr:acyl-CoA dehydrogenase family protein [Burkholderiaceae bacterium]